MAKKNAVETTDKIIIVDELVTDAGKYGNYHISDIRISKTNRKRFNEANMQELAASIKEMGLAQPILIRPVTPTETEPQKYEIVAGERRFRASIIAGCTTIPALLKTLTDLQAAKIQILENLQRENPHPLEEAEGYENLMLAHGYNADQLAAELKKSRSYIYGRLKLCALALDVREQFLDDKFSASTALLVARIPVPALQVKAVGEITAVNWNGEPMSYRAAAIHIQNRYMLELTRAVFKIEDAKLLPVAGSCAKCPKRTGNQPEIFTDIAPNICTDPDCFAEKTGAHYAHKITFANKSGIPVFDENDDCDVVDDIYHDDTNCTDISSLNSFEWVLPEHNGLLNKAAVSLLPTALVPIPVCMVKLDDGTVEAVYLRADVQAALIKAGFCSEEQEEESNEVTAENGTTLATKTNDAYAERMRLEKENKEKAERETNFREALYKKVREQNVSGIKLVPLRELAKCLIKNNYVSIFDSIKSMYPAGATDSDEALCAHIDKASFQNIQILLLDLAFGDAIKVSPWRLDQVGNENDSFNDVLAMAKGMGIDPDKVRADLERRAALIEPWPFPSTHQELAGAA